MGVRYSPEFACFPLKLNLGNFIEAFQMGADTVLMAGGVGPCRFGYYAQVQREILKDLGYDLDLIVLEPPRGHMGDLLNQLRRLKVKAGWTDVIRASRLAWKKLKAVEAIERAAHKSRPRAFAPAQVNRLQRSAIALLDEASDARSIDEIVSEYKRDLLMLTKRTNGVRDGKEPPVRVGIVGEIYMVLEPFANQNLEEMLGELGAEVDRSVFLSDWAFHHVFLDALRIKKGGSIKEAARPYLRHFVGGEGLESVGNTVLYAKRGFDGVIQVMPFTCMPEIVAQSILVKVSKDLDIPVLHLTLDEHSGEAGLQTRLEAFVDLLKWRRRQKGVRSG